MADENTTPATNDPATDEQKTNEPSNAPLTDQKAAEPVNPADVAVTSTGVDLTASPGVGGGEPEANDETAPGENVATAAVNAADPTPQEEAAFNVAAHPDNRNDVTPGDNTGNPTPLQSDARAAGRVVDIDSSGIGVQTNQDVIDNFPKNDQGQVVIGEDGRIEGLEDAQQPAQGNVSSNPSTDTADAPKE